MLFEIIIWFIAIMAAGALLLYDVAFWRTLVIKEEKPMRSQLVCIISSFLTVLPVVTGMAYRVRDLFVSLLVLLFPLLSNIVSDTKASEMKRSAIIATVFVAMIILALLWHSYNVGETIPHFTSLATWVPLCAICVWSTYAMNE